MTHIDKSHIKIISALIIIGAFLVMGCSSNKNNTKHLKKKFSKADSSQVLERYYSPYIGYNTLQVDTTFIYKNDTINIVINSYSLNDSLLTFERYSTNGKIITKHIVVCHNGNIDISITQNGKQTKYTLDKMVFAEKIMPEKVKASSSQSIEIELIMKSESKILISALFCIPYTDYCSQGYAVFDWMSGELIFTDENCYTCGSNLQAIEGEVILCCDGVLDFDGNNILSFDENVVLSEFVDNSTILVVYDLIQKNGTTDFKSDNAFVYNTKGELQYSFQFDAYFTFLYYAVGFIRSGESEQLILFDFKKNIYYKPKAEGVEKYDIKKVSDDTDLSDYKNYIIYTNFGKFEVFIKDNKVVIVE